jgi:hypothetical protein
MAICRASWPLFFYNSIIITMKYCYECSILTHCCMQLLNWGLTLHHHLPNQVQKLVLHQGHAVACLHISPLRCNARKSCFPVQIPGIIDQHTNDMVEIVQIINLSYLIKLATKKVNEYNKNLLFINILPFKYGTHILNRITSIILY